MPDDALKIAERQIFAPVESSRTHARRPHCTPFTLPSGGHIVVNPTSTLTITSNVIFQPECSPTSSIAVAFDNNGITGIDAKEPFHASVTPQAYATGAATVIAWMLVVMLLITPRTFFVGGVGGGFGMLNRHGMISGAQGSASVIGVGSRPWLQKVAALTVAISLTIATADTFEVAEQQYATGFMNADSLRGKVVGSTEIKVSRVISDIFLWLAQVQTLIRLFPRHKEKVLIKWIGFALIILDATFTCLNSFMGNPVGRPRKFRDAIPALSYLFQLALSMLYAAWVIYYAICKRKYAFYHKDMWNITLVAALAFVAILTPVVFFITDISNASVAGWGDYFRWVGAAAASVIVWEWVERIEALEREEKKDGILGREIFDGDEMLDHTPSEEVVWPRRRRFWRGGLDRRGSGDGGPCGVFTSRQQQHGINISTRALHPQPLDRHDDEGPIKPLRRLSRVAEIDSQTHLKAGSRMLVTPPPAAASPISRTDTASAASTVYTVRYHTVATPQPMVRYNPQSKQNAPPVPSRDRPISVVLAQSGQMNEKDVIEMSDDIAIDLEHGESKAGRFHMANPFKRKKALPPAEVRGGQVIDPVSVGTSRRQPAHNYERWDIKGRVGAYAAEQGERWREKRGGNQTDVDMPVTIIPAQPRGRTWSPDVQPETQNTEPSQDSDSPTAVESQRSSSADGEVSLQFDAPGSSRDPDAAIPSQRRPPPE